VNDTNHQTALDAGSIFFNGPRQIYRPDPIILATSNGLGRTFVATVLIPVPSGQTKIKGSILWSNDNGGATPELGSVWVSACEQDRSGGTTALYPVTDLDGTSAAPTAFPASSGLFGYSRSFVTSADWLQFVITLNSAGEGLAGNWIFQTLIQPVDGMLFPWKSWDQIRREFVPQLPSGQGTI